MGGASGLENNYVVDGVNITNTGYGAVGSYSIVFGSLGTGVTYDFIKEIQVKTGGFEAEYGQSTGGVVNVRHQERHERPSRRRVRLLPADGLEGECEQVQTENGTVNTTGTRRTTSGSRSAGRSSGQAVLLRRRSTRSGRRAPSRRPPASRSEPGRSGSEAPDQLLLRQGDLAVGNGHRFDVSVFGDPAKGDMGPQRTASLVRTDTVGFSELEYGGHNQTVQVRRRASAELAGRGLGLARAEQPDRDAVESTSSRSPTRPWCRTWSPAASASTRRATRAPTCSIRLKSTHIFGGHQIRYGVLYEDIQYDNINQYTGPTFTLPDGQADVDRRHGRDHRRPELRPDLPGHARQPASGAARRRSSYWLLRAGHVARRQAADRAPGHPVRAAEARRATPSPDFTWDGNWAPRIGATYDIIGNGRSKLYANWGRFFAKVPNDLGGARALGRRRRDPRRLLRRRR